MMATLVKKVGKPKCAECRLQRQKCDPADPEVAERIWIEGGQQDKCARCTKLGHPCGPSQYKSPNDQADPRLPAAASRKRRVSDMGQPIEDDGATVQTQSIRRESGSSQDVSGALQCSLTEIDRRQEALGKLDQDLVSIDLTDGNLENQIRFNALVEVKEATFAKQLAMLRMAKDSAISLQEAGCTADAYIAYTRILEGYHKLDMPTGYDVRNILINMAKILWANKDDYRAQSLAWQDLESRDQTLRAHPSDLRLLKDIARSLLRTTPEIQQIIQSQMPGQPPYPCNSLLPALHAMIESKSNYASQVSGNVLQPGPYPDLNGDPPPESPIVGGIQAVLEFLGEFSDTQLEARDSRGRTPLFLAAFHCKEGLGLALLIRAKNDPRMLYRVVTARDRSGQTVLSVAISSRCSLLFVTALIDHGAEVDPHMVAQAMTPLQAACSVGSLEIVDLLMTKGATTNAAYPDNSPPPPLAIAQEQGHIDIVDRLSYSSPGSTRSYTARENDCGG